MKKLLIVLTCILLSGCVSDKLMENATEVSESGNALTEETVTTSIYIDDTFHGFTDAGETPKIGNSVSCLNRNGIVYNGDELIYADSSGDLKKGDVVIAENVMPKCINVLDEKIYFINGTDNKIYCFNDGQTELYLDVQAVLFALTDEYSVYEDMKNALYINRDNNTELVSDKTVLWVDFYGKYIIFCELADGCKVSAYDTKSGEKHKLLDYGFFPTVHGDMLYYQEKENGYICRLELLTGEISTEVSEWGQQFSFVNDEMFYISSRGIFSAEKGAVYIPEEGITAESLFECGGELFFTEKSDAEMLYRLDAETGERTLIK